MLLINEKLRELVYHKITQIRCQKLDDADITANYVMKYFNDNSKHVAGLRKIIQKGGRLAYIVGSSEMKRVQIPTDIIL